MGMGKVSVDDMENLCIRYLTGSTIGVPYRFHDQSFGGSQARNISQSVTQQFGGIGR